MTQPDTVNRKAFSLYPLEETILAYVAREMFEGNESQAVRFIIRDWAKQVKASNPIDIKELKQLAK